MAQPTTARFGKMRVMIGKPEMGTPVAVTNLSNANPAVVTVALADIDEFANGDQVTIAGAIGDMSAANGSHKVAGLDAGAGTFQLEGVNLSSAAAPATTGITAAAPTGEIIYTAPCGFTTKGLTLSKNLQELDIPDCDDPDAPFWLARDVQNLSASISGDGVAAAESVPDWNAAFMSTDSIPMLVEVEFTTGTKSFEGLFHVDNLTFGAESGGRVTLAVSAQSDGEIIDTWTPVVGAATTFRVPDVAEAA